MTCAPNPRQLGTADEARLLSAEEACSCKLLLCFGLAPPGIVCSSDLAALLTHHPPRVPQAAPKRSALHVVREPAAAPRQTPHLPLQWPRQGACVSGHSSVSIRNHRALTGKIWAGHQETRALPPLGVAFSSVG